MRFAFFIGRFILIVAGWALLTGISHAAGLTNASSSGCVCCHRSQASIFASVSAACGGFVSIFERVADGLPDGGLEAVPRFVAGGLAQAIMAPMVGFALLAVAWGAATIGVRKQQ